MRQILDVSWLTMTNYHRTASTLAGLPTCLKALRLDEGQEYMLADQPPSTKVCPSCAKSLPLSLSFFYFDKSRKDGLSCRCKDCSKSASLRWKANNPDRLREIKKQYREINPEKQKKHRKRYRDTHLDKERARCRAWNKKKPRTNSFSAQTTSVV